MPPTFAAAWEIGGEWLLMGAVDGGKTSNIIQQVSV